MGFLSPIFSKPPQLQWVFPDYTDEQVLTTWNNVEKITPKYQTLREPEATESDRWLAYSIHHAVTKFPNADKRDQYSFAALCQSFFTGWYGGFGTETYEKERKIQNQAIFLLNRLTEISVSDEAKAKILLIFLEDKYFGGEH